MTIRERRGEEPDAQYAELVSFARAGNQEAFFRALQALGLPEDARVMIATFARLDAVTQNILESGETWLQAVKSQRDDAPPKSTG